MGLCGLTGSWVFSTLLVAGPLRPWTADVPGASLHVSRVPWLCPHRGGPQLFLGLVAGEAGRRPGAVPGCGLHFGVWDRGTTALSLVSSAHTRLPLHLWGLLWASPPRKPSGAEGHLANGTLEHGIHHSLSPAGLAWPFPWQTRQAAPGAGGCPHPGAKGAHEAPA